MLIKETNKDKNKDLKRGVIRLSKNQTMIFLDKTRFVVLKAGRRFGKTYVAGSFLINACIGVDRITGEKCEDRFVVYISPTHEQGRRQMGGWINQYVPKHLIKTHTKSPFFYEFYNGSKLYIYSAEKYENIRGDGANTVVVDECGTIKDDAWNLAIRPMLADNAGDALLIGTPKPFGWFNDVIELGKDIKEKDYTLYTFTSLQGGNIPRSEIDLMQRTMSERHFRQEMEASSEIMGDIVIDYFSEENIQPCQDTGGEIIIGMDFNVDPITAVLCNEVGDELHIFKEYKIRNYDTSRLMQDIVADYPNREMIVYPDPTGRSRKSSALAGMTDHTIIEHFGGTVVCPGVNSVADAINTLNAMMRNFDGQRRIKIDPSCEELISDLTKWIYDPKLTGRQPDKKNGFDHLCEALYYITFSRYPMKEFASIKNLPIWGR